MSAGDAYGLGYERVDDDPNVSILVATMDATSRWAATRRLRRWERAHLHLEEGQRLLDVGCGLGTAAVALADDLGAAGEVVGIDRSAAMLSVARERCSDAASDVRFSIGDALALDEPDASFDAARCERTLQWVADPQRAVEELRRVLRPGGRVSLIDTDWSTMRIDVGDPDVTARVRDAFRRERRRPSNVGSRLVELVRVAGFEGVERTTATQRWTEWDPTTAPAPAGCFSMGSLAEDLVATGHLEPADTKRFVSTIEGAAGRGQFAMSLTLFGVVATASRR